MPDKHMKASSLRLEGGALPLAPSPRNIEVRVETQSTTLLVEWTCRARFCLQLPSGWFQSVNDRRWTEKEVETYLLSSG